MDRVMERGREWKGERRQSGGGEKEGELKQVGDYTAMACLSNTINYSFIDAPVRCVIQLKQKC